MRRRLRKVTLCSCILFLGPCLSGRLAGKAIVATPLDDGGSISVVYLEDQGGQRIEFQGLSPETAKKADPRIEVYTADPAETELPAILGQSVIEGNSARFLPTFPLQSGLQYFVLLKPLQGKASRFSFTIPRQEQPPVTTVAAVYPSRSDLPENLLKFYLHFSNPMSHGDVYQYIRLLDENGKALELPFLELGEELWDYDNRRLTLLFDPGRIKTGLVPNLEEGMVLEQGKSYTLQIDKNWPDAEGRPLMEGFEKHFTVGPADTASPNTGSWRKYWPRVETRQPVTLIFPESMDEALLQRVIVVLDENENPLSGSVRIGKEETRWDFIPDQPWGVGKYRIKIETILEDLAGNSIARPFELDKQLSESYRKAPKVEYLNLVFQ